VLGINLEDGPTGPIVAVVLPDSGAAEAGIQDGDIVESLDGTSYRTAEGLRKALGALYPGDRVKLSIRRGDERLDLTAELRDRWQLLIGDRAELMVNGPTNGRASGFEQAIQHDTVLEPNRCGGPIVDIEGHVVALNIARAGRVATYAIPAEIVQRDINSMLEELAQAETIATPDAETTPVSAVQGGE
jgi:S1-C subfamily serine protease